MKTNNTKIGYHLRSRFYHDLLMAFVNCMSSSYQVHGKLVSFMAPIEKGHMPHSSRFVNVVRVFFFSSSEADDVSILLKAWLNARNIVA